MTTWFGAGWDDFGNDPDFLDRRPGDWLGVNELDGYELGSHTQMFLAYEPDEQRYWYVEGNGSCSNPTGRIQHSVNVGSSSRCDDSGGKYRPASASVCSSGAFKIRSVGKIDESKVQ